MLFQLLLFCTGSQKCVQGRVTIEAVSVKRFTIGQNTVLIFSQENWVNSVKNLYSKTYPATNHLHSVINNVTHYFEWHKEPRFYWHSYCQQAPFKFSPMKEIYCAIIKPCWKHGNMDPWFPFIIYHVSRGKQEAYQLVRNSGHRKKLFVRQCVAVAKWSKALGWLSCTRLRERPGFNGYSRRTLARPTQPTTWA